MARTRLRELLELRVDWVIGPVTSTVAAAVLPLVNERRVPMISPLAGANDFSGRDDAFFRVVSDSAASARQQGQALLTRGLRRIVTVADTKNAVFTRNWVGSAGEQIKAGGGAMVLPYHRIASSQAFVEACRNGLAWGMNPEALVATDLATGTLCELVADTALDVPLYWQFTRLAAAALAPLTAAIRTATRAALIRPS